MKRKTAIQSSDQPIAMPEGHTDAASVPPADYNRTIKEGPGVVIPAHGEPRRHTMTAQQPTATQTIREQSDGVRAAIPYRSLKRPPTAVLIALDDGSTDSGQEWRIRGSRFIIGRTKGDAVIPHDIDLSGEHAEINCQEHDGGFQWQLRDLKSTNGTFLRVQRVVLRNGKQLLLGGRRYAFRQPGVVVDGAAASEVQQSPAGSPRVTQQFGRVPADAALQLTARLAELTVDGEGCDFLLGEEASWIGSNPSQCRLVVSGDPFIDPQHARFYRDNRARWVVEDCKSLNGVWVRVEHIPLDNASEFQLGGQRFRFRY